jgi:hypothetical protein
MVWLRRIGRGALAVLGLFALASWPVGPTAAETPRPAVCDRFEQLAMGAVPRSQQRAILGIDWQFCTPHRSSGDGDGPVYRFEVDVVDLDVETDLLVAFEDVVVDTLTDRRGWGGAGAVRLRPTVGDGDFRVVLASPEAVDGAAEGCSARYSCRVGDTVWINADRWERGTPTYQRAGESLLDYRRMVINHEVGHWLGFGHEDCAAEGEPAPVMQQQSKDLQGCEANPWPLPDEQARLTE